MTIFGAKSFPSATQRCMLSSMKRLATSGFVRIAAQTGFLLACMLWPGMGLRASDTSAADPHSVPVVDGSIGPCSAEFIVKDGAGSPVYDSKIRVHIAYGVFHKLDLEVGTNIDGKARFTGLPNRVKQPLLFRASQEDREGSATVDPAAACRAERAILISKAPADSSQP
jgi:hypothetical protein